MQRLVSGCVEIQPLNASVIRVDKITGKTNVILMEGVVKGYHECPFTVRTGESFVLEKNIGFAAAQVNVSANIFGQILVGLL